MPPRDSSYAPGSPEAIRDGCTCSAATNRDGEGAGHNGRGEPLYITAKRCPMHGEEKKKRKGAA